MDNTNIIETPAPALILTLSSVPSSQGWTDVFWWRVPCREVGLGSNSCYDRCKNDDSSNMLD